MPPEDSKEYSWKWVTGNECLSLRPCELCTVIQTCKATACRADIYDGENNLGRFLMRLECLANRSISYVLHHHAYCRRGLYIELSDDTYGVFVQWLERPQGRGGE